MSAFDPSTFLDAQIDTPDERRLPLPEGVYTAMIGEPSIKTGDKDGKPWASILIPLTIDVPQQVQEEQKLQAQLTLTHRGFMDLTPQGLMDNGPGKNRVRRLYREALGLNKPGEAFNWRMIQGKPVKVSVKHELYEGNIQERIDTVLPA